MANIDDLDAAGPELPAARSRGFLTVLWQRKALLILATLLGLVGGSLFYWQRPPIYQSASQILIIKKQPVLPVAERMGYADDYMSTHLEVLRSPLIIERAIKKAIGGDSENYDEIRYEGYGPGGVALIVEALTDNRNRAASDLVK